MANLVIQDYTLC